MKELTTYSESDMRSKINEIVEEFNKLTSDVSKIHDWINKYEKHINASVKDKWVNKFSKETTPD